MLTAAKKIRNRARSVLGELYGRNPETGLAALGDTLAGLRQKFLNIETRLREFQDETYRRSTGTVM